MASIKNITVPDLGGATDVSVIELLVKPGDKIQVDTPIATLESDKATLELPSSDAGVVKELKIKVGDKVSTGSVLLTLEVQGEVAKAATDSESRGYKELSSRAALSAGPSVFPPKTLDPAVKPRDDNFSAAGRHDIHAGPGVRRLARELDLNLALITGSGPKQRITKDDVRAYVQARMGQGAPGLPAAPSIDFSKFGEVETTPLSRIKKIVGKNLQRIWMTVPQVTQFGAADITDLEAFRQRQKDKMEKQNIRLTPLVFIMKAVVTSLKAFPQFNASLDASGENLILKKYFHLGIAVDTPEGLVVPVIRDIDKKGLIELAKELAVISEKARNKQLTPGEMQGGCFSISSLGGIGGTAFTPIVNSPEVAILGLSKAQQQPVYQDGVFVPRLMLPLSLSYDHRVIDGADGARFMVHLAGVLADIWMLLM